MAGRKEYLYRSQHDVNQITAFVSARRLPAPYRGRSSHSPDTGTAPPSFLEFCSFNRWSTSGSSASNVCVWIWPVLAFLYFSSIDTHKLATDISARFTRCSGWEGFSRSPKVNSSLPMLWVGFLIAASRAISLSSPAGANFTFHGRNR